MKIAIIGAGLIAQTRHVPALLANGVEITAVYDRRAEKAHAMADPLGAQAYTDYHELLKDENVDAVSICTRTDMHCRMAVAAAEAGKNIFLEKPMAMNAQEARRIVEAVENNGVIFMLGMLNRFRTEAQILSAHLADGRMGEVYHADARWIRRRGIPTNPWFSQKALSGGGPSIDIGVHTIDLAWYLMGCPEPLSVSAMTHHRLGKVYAKGLEYYGTTPPSLSGEMDTEDSAVAFIRFEGKKTMTLTVSWAINGPDEDFNIKVYGTKEGASLNPFVIYGMDEGYCMDTKPVFSREDAWAEGFANEMAHFLHCVDAGVQPLTSAQNCYTVARIIDCIYLSDQLGREINFSEVP